MLQHPRVRDCHWVIAQSDPDRIGIKNYLSQHSHTRYRKFANVSAARRMQYQRDDNEEPDYPVASIRNV
jgi:hypothetical protein